MEGLKTFDVERNSIPFDNVSHFTKSKFEHGTRFNATLVDGTEIELNIVEATD